MLGGSKSIKGGIGAGFSDWLAVAQERNDAEGGGVRLYGHPDTRTSRSLWMACELEGLDCGLHAKQIAVFRFNEETDKINPNRRMPFLDDNGTAVFESMAINLYLARKYGKDTPLAPKDWKEEAEFMKWSFWAMTELDMTVWELVLCGPARIDPDHPWYTHPVVRNPNKQGKDGMTGEERYFEWFTHPRSAMRERKLAKSFRRSISALEQHLAAGRQYLVGDRFTAADINVCSVLAWARHLGWSAFDEFPLTRAYLQRASGSHAHPGLL